jgi:hypothetical protein
MSTPSGHNQRHDMQSPHSKLVKRKLVLKRMLPVQARKGGGEGRQGPGPFARDIFLWIVHTVF